MFLRGDSVILVIKMGEEMWTEAEGQSANNIAMGLEDTYTTMMMLKNEPVDRLYETGENDTTQEKDHIFVWKDIWRQLEMSRDSPKVFNRCFHTATQPVQCKDGLYAGYCGAIPIPRYWYWYSIVGRQKSSISNTKPILKF
jgi:hypothetical protein